MRYVFCVLTFLFHYSVFAESVNLRFERVPVVQFVAATYGEILGRDFVLSPDALAVDKTVSMRVQVDDAKHVPPVLSEILKFAGLSVQEKSGVFYVDVLHNEVALLDPNGFGSGDVIEVYVPRFRSVDYLSALISFVDRSVSATASSALVGASAFEKSNVSSASNTATVSSSGNVAPVSSLPVSSSISSLSSSSASANQDVLVFTGSKERVDKILSFLNRIDTPPVSVLVRAALIEVSVSDDRSFNVGVALNLLGSRLGVSLAGTMSDNYIRIKGASVDAFISAVAGDARYKIITEPRLVVGDGQTGKISVGNEVPTRGAVTYDDSGNAIQSIEYRSSGVIFSVTPRIYRDRVALQLSQQISNFSQTTTSGIDSPTLVKRDVETSLDLADGQLLVMAGLDEEKSSNSRSGLPFLPAWLSSTSGTNSKTQVLLVLEVHRVGV